MSQKPIESIKGIGDKTGKLFRKLGIDNIDHLLHYYPRAYDIFEEAKYIGACQIEEISTVMGKIQTKVEVKRIRNFQITTTTIRDHTQSLQLNWFHMPYLKSTLRLGETYYFRGKIVKKRGVLLIEQPEVYTEEAYKKLLHSMQPIYGQTKGLGNKTITKTMNTALEERELEVEYLPMEIRKKFELAEYNFAIEHIHFPIDKKDLLFARKRLVFEEFFFFLLAIKRLKETREQKISNIYCEDFSGVDEFRKKLPFILTKAQESVWEEIKKDLSSKKMMNRLIQGDVGSGKTIIALFSLFAIAEIGYQGALMVPTEVLAKQHYESIQALIEKNNLKIRPLLLTGSMTAKEKRLAYDAIANHQVDVIIGTHALIQERVKFHKLGLVITDEQHRFGVVQRETLGGKGEEPHIIVMSATPIPRTLAIILYGDLDISVIDELPAERLPIKNCVIGISDRKKAYDFIKKEVVSGRQGYVICPMVEESEMIEAENVTDYSKSLQQELGETIKVKALHGKMKAKEKNEIMEAYGRREIDVLVSTTVIEVGVNVPNATVMLIENAERFGLAQLHQLRGRVGRGKYQSYCIMVNTSKDQKTGERLDILNRSNDGFYIASEDLKLRGPGDLFGVRQSGEMEFRLGDIFTDAKFLKQIADEVDRLLEKDPMLEKEEYKGIRLKLDAYRCEVQY